MGYDMRIRGNVPAAPEHDVRQAKNAFEAASAAYQKRMQVGEFGYDLPAQIEARRELDELWDRWYSLREPGCFQLNN